jgi:diguanylate cyclase (GGDEF)-like protein
VPARYGGEEFAVVLEGVDEAEAAVCAERLRLAIAAIDAPECPRVTASVGVALLGEGVAGKSALIEAADGALYAAKAAGKDRVAVWQNARSSCAAPGTSLV